MNEKKRMTRTFCLWRVSILLMLLSLLSVELLSQTIRLSTSKDPESGLPRIAVEGPAGVTASLQVSGPLGAHWTTVETISLTGAPRVILDRQANGNAPRFYRAKLEGGGTVTLSDLADLPNQVFVAGEGFDTVQYAPNGSLGLIFWRNRDLVMRERVGSSWTEQVVATDGNLFSGGSVGQFLNFQPAAMLLYDEASSPHIFQVNGASSIAHYTRAGGSWARSENISVGGSPSSIARLVGAAGPNGAFHLGAVGTSGNLAHGTTKTGSWRWSVAAQIAAEPYWTPGSYSRRWLSLAVDSRNAAHFVFRPVLTMNAPGGYPQAYTELTYATDRSGSWSTQIVRKPDDTSGEAGSGQSIAIGPNDLPSIASWYNERGPGGSSQWSRLQFYQKEADGSWARSEVISRPDTYISGDGEKGAGAQPHLRYDAQGRPHILFLDHASEHFPYQNEYAGHVRHAWLSGGSWQLESIYRQSAPLQEQGIFPSFAMNGREMTAIVLERLTQWNTAVNPQVALSTYKFRVITKPLP